jgi:hypothetical protein
MIRKIFAVGAVALAIGAATTVFGTPAAEAKCKFGCGLAIGLGAGIVGSAIINDQRRGDRGYDDDYYGPPRTRYYRSRDCGGVSYECRRSWGYRNSDYYGCMRYHGC